MMHCTLHTRNPETIFASHKEIFFENVQLMRMDKIAIRIHFNIYSFSPQLELNLLCPN